MNATFTNEARANAIKIIQLADIIPENKFNEFIQYLDGYKDGINAAARASKKVEEELNGSINSRAEG